MEWNGIVWSGMGWDGMGWDEMVWDGMEWDGMGWDGMEWNKIEFNFPSEYKQMIQINERTIGTWKWKPGKFRFCWAGEGGGLASISDLGPSWMVTLILNDFFLISTTTYLKTNKKQLNMQKLTT